MPSKPLKIPTRRAVRVDLVGLVQGLGVRPAVARLAQRLELVGSVANTANGLQIDIAGDEASVALFLASLEEALPCGARIEGRSVRAMSEGDNADFEIRPRICHGTESAATPHDRAVCETCLQEVFDATNRRSEYPFTSCTQCGPRYSVLRAMPYDRAATSMEHFDLCEACAVEYRSSHDRRFHSQTNACSACGPQLRLVNAAGQDLGNAGLALDTAARALLAGLILALQGLGGYQLLVDATSDDAVRRLRCRKKRPVKPLAVMVQDLRAAELLAQLEEDERRALVGPAGPIVLVRQRAATALSTQIAPEFPTCGLMLPTTPLHALLLARVGRPLVATSGNFEGGALAYDQQSALGQLAQIADVWLCHDRPILRPIDDSVVRLTGHTMSTLRLARGLAPLQLPDLAVNVPSIALGGDQKSAIALSNGKQAVLGPHIGDLSSHDVCTRWEKQLHALATLYGVPMAEAEFVHDAHPDFFSTDWARRQTPRRVAVYHHHAHVAATMLEHQLDREVLGLAWDGVGYGLDATVWGSEALCASRTGFRRVGYLRPFLLLGAELAIREPWRVALSLIDQALGGNAWQRLAWQNVPPERIKQATQLLSRPQISPRTSSMGRLFDGVAALALGLSEAHHEGRPAMLLEFAADRQALGSYPLPWDRATGQADWRPLIAAVWTDLRQGTPPGTISIRFHRAVADWAVELSHAYIHLPLVISGGVFQNALLRELLDERLGDRAAGWFVPRQIPPGDGGLAAGQLAVAIARRRFANQES